MAIPAVHLGMRSCREDHATIFAAGLPIQTIQIGRVVVRVLIVLARSRSRTLRETIDGPLTHVVIHGIMRRSTAIVTVIVAGTVTVFKVQVVVAVAVHFVE
jgi:hypothetical protein